MLSKWPVGIGVSSYRNRESILQLLCMSKMKMSLCSKSNTRYMVLLSQLRSARIWNKIRNQSKTHRVACRQSLSLKTSSIPNMKMSSSPKSNTHYTALLSQSRSARIWNKIHNRSKTQRVPCCQNAPLESGSMLDLGVAPLYTKSSARSFLSLSPYSLSQFRRDCNGTDLYVCLSNILENGGVWNRTGDVHTAPRGLRRWGKSPMRLLSRSRQPLDRSSSNFQGRLLVYARNLY